MYAGRIVCFQDLCIATTSRTEAEQLVFWTRLVLFLYGAATGLGCRSLRHCSLYGRREVALVELYLQTELVDNGLCCCWTLMLSTVRLTSAIGERVRGNDLHCYLLDLRLRFLDSMLGVF